MADKIKAGEKDALIVVDVQKCFLPGGSLGVAGGDRVIPLINELENKFNTMAFTRDWHPPDHCSFAQDPEFTHGSWPRHCVQNTEGAEFGDGLVTPDDAIYILKGQDPDKEAYSGFEDSDLGDRLGEKGVKRVFLTGIALDVCVKDTALDGIRQGFEVYVVEDAARPVDNPPGMARDAVEEMTKAGVKIIKSADIE